MPLPTWMTSLSTAPPGRSISVTCNRSSPWLRRRALLFTQTSVPWPARRRPTWAMFWDGCDPPSGWEGGSHHGCKAANHQEAGAVVPGSCGLVQALFTKLFSKGVCTDRADPQEPTQQGGMDGGVRERIVGLKGLFVPRAGAPQSRL